MKSIASAATEADHPRYEEIVAHERSCGRRVLDVGYARSIQPHERHALAVLADSLPDGAWVVIFEGKKLYLIKFQDEVRIYGPSDLPELDPMYRELAEALEQTRSQ